MHGSLAQWDRIEKKFSEDCKKGDYSKPAEIVVRAGLIIASSEGLIPFGSLIGFGLMQLGKSFLKRKS